MKSTKKLLLLLCYAVFSAGVFAETVTVSGKLMSAVDNEGLPFATVAIAREENPQYVIRRFATNIDGAFQTELAPGTYIFVFQSAGMNNLQKTIEVAETPNPLDLGEIFMAYDAELLGEVSITALRPLVRVELDRLVYSVQDDPEAATSNVLDILRNVPLVTVDGEDRIQLRGSTNFIVYLNGRRSNMITNNPSQVLRSMPANTIRNIEVITEPGARYAAEGIGGIINIVTDQRVDDGYVGSVGAWVNTYGGFGTHAFLTAKRGKFGFTGNIHQGINPHPETIFLGERLDFSPLAENTFTQHGTERQRSNFLGGSAMLSFEPDTLNLFTISINGNTGRWDSDSEVEFESRGAREFNYTQVSSNGGLWGGMSLSADYQRNFRRKGEKLTISYQWQHSPGDRFTNFHIPFADGNAPFAQNWHQRSHNNSSGNEHTGQIDYVNPLTERHVIEAGLKHIFRHNVSEGIVEFLDENTEIWETLPQRSADLNHRQQISAAYASYSLRLSKFSFRAGVRAEYTNQIIQFANDDPVPNSFFDPVPNVTLSYRIRPTTTLRGGYNMRIQRPGIWLLNPFVHDNDPTNIRYGNPDLESENIHNFNLGFGHFQRQFNINATLSYNFSNNAILWYSFAEGDVIHNTVGNIGTRRNADLSVFGSWTPIPALRINLNGGVSYVEIQSENDIGTASGVRARVSTNMTYTIQRVWRLGFNGGFFPSPVQLQTTQSGHHFYVFSLTRSFLDRKLDVSFRAISPFERTRSWERETTGTGFVQSSSAQFPMRQFNIGVNWRFGELQSQVRRVERTITNEDVIGGQQQQGGGGQN